jgi:branched-subunit amino acid ABC-type transport system permease component
MGLVPLYFVLSLPLIGAYVMLALGVTLIYQSSRVLNLAHGAIAMAGAYTTFQLWRWHLPLAIAVVGGVVASAALGLLVERVFVRGLRSSGPTTQTVGTVAALTFAIAVASRLFGTLPVAAPSVLPGGALQLGNGHVNLDLLFVFPIGVVAAVILFGLFQFTDIGLAMRGAAQNRRGAALRGVDPDLTAGLAWAMGGALAGLTGILLAGATGLDPFGISLGVLPAFVAALIGGLDSMPGVLLGAAAVGLVVGMVPAIAAVPQLAGFAQAQGAPQLVLGVVALIVMAARGVRLSTSDVKGDAL